MHCNVALVVHHSFALVIAGGCIAMSALIAAALALTCLCLHAVQRGTTDDNDDDYHGHYDKDDHHGDDDDPDANICI